MSSCPGGRNIGRGRTFVIVWFHPSFPMIHREKRVSEGELRYRGCSTKQEKMWKGEDLKTRGGKHERNGTNEAWAPHGMQNNSHT